jgi:hypothetical protein
MDPTDASFFDLPQPMTQSGPRPILRFFIEPVERPGKSQVEGRPIFEDCDMVAITNPGSRDEFVKEVDEKVKRDPWTGAMYARWKATQQQPIDGTPLSMVPFLAPSQIKELQGINILTLEHLANAPDTAVQRMMGMVELRKKAKSYLEAAEGSKIVTRLESELAQRDRDIAAMKEQITKLNARFEAAQKDQAA